MYTLYTTCALILIRNIVRVAEFVEGFNGFIILHEVFLYVFDGIPMAAVLIAFLVWYPSDLSQRAKAAEGDLASEESIGLSNSGCAEDTAKYGQSLKPLAGIKAQLGRLMPKK